VFIACFQFPVIAAALTFAHHRLFVHVIFYLYYSFRC
jgi:hypothetical protein